MMINPYIYIDDSGLANGNIENPFYLPTSKLYVAIIIKANEKKKIERELSKELSKLKKKHKEITEFHAKNIYSGTKEYQSLTPEERLDIFQKMVHYYNEYRFPILYSAVSKEAIDSAGFSEGLLGDKIDNFLLSKPEDMALMSVLGQCDDYIMQYRNKYGRNCNIEVIVDEGRQKAGTKQAINYSARAIREIQYANSEDEPMLQMADFLAFVINRCQVNFCKEQSYFDKRFMEIVGKIHYDMRNDFMKVPYRRLDKMKKEDYLEQMMKVNENQKKEKYLRNQAVEYANKLHEECSRLKAK